VKRRKKAGDQADIDMTPMLDIVFIMLIFFIVTATFTKESGIDLSRPDTQEQKKQEEKKSIVVQISGTDGIFIDGRRVDLRAVRANVERMHAELPEAPVVILAEPGAHNGTLVSVLDYSRQAGVTNVSIASNQ
jgi:biopolymer transport protein ExbD